MIVREESENIKSLTKQLSHLATYVSDLETKLATATLAPKSTLLSYTQTHLVIINQRKSIYNHIFCDSDLEEVRHHSMSVGKKRALERYSPPSLKKGKANSIDDCNIRKDNRVSKRRGRKKLIGNCMRNELYSLSCD